MDFALSLTARLADEDDPELRHVLGLTEFAFGEFRLATEHLEQAFRMLRESGRIRPAALVAVSLGRVFFDGIGNEPLGLGWLARAETLLEQEEPCVEKGWAASPTC